MTGDPGALSSRHTNYCTKYVASSQSPIARISQPSAICFIRVSIPQCLAQETDTTTVWASKSVWEERAILEPLPSLEIDAVPSLEIDEEQANIELCDINEEHDVEDICRPFMLPTALWYLLHAAITHLSFLRFQSPTGTLPYTTSGLPPIESERGPFLKACDFELLKLWKMYIQGCRGGDGTGERRYPVWCSLVRALAQSLEINLSKDRETIISEVLPILEGTSNHAKLQ